PPWLTEGLLRGLRYWDRLLGRLVDEGREGEVEAWRTLLHDHLRAQPAHAGFGHLVHGAAGRLLHGVAEGHVVDVDVYDPLGRSREALLQTEAEPEVGHRVCVDGGDGQERG